MGGGPQGVKIASAKMVLRVGVYIVMVGIDAIEIALDAILIASRRSTDHILAGQTAT